MKKIIFSVLFLSFFSLGVYAQQIKLDNGYIPPSPAPKNPVNPVELQPGDDGENKCNRQAIKAICKNGVEESQCTTAIPHAAGKNCKIQCRVEYTSDRTDTVQKKTCVCRTPNLAFSCKIK
jgi:hypothetical protein